jgi:hypothetical protein
MVIDIYTYRSFNAMNNIQYMIDKIKDRIPIEILNLGFLPKPRFNVIPTTMEDELKKKIIVGKVLRDCNLFGGIETYIDVSNCKMEYVDTGMVIYVGFAPTGGRRIVSALSLGFASIMTGSNAPTIASAVSNPFVLSDARLELIGENIIYVDGYLGTRFTTLKCVMNRDDDFGSIPQRAIPMLGDLSVYATETYLYTNLKIRLASGEIVQGVDMGVIKDLVDEYSGAYDIYSDLLIKWRKVSIFADKAAKTRLLRALMPST